MKNYILLLFGLNFIFAQNGEGLSALSAINKGVPIKKNRDFVIDGEWVFVQDTLSLPLVDDFSTDKFYPSNLDVSGPNVTQEVYYRLNINTTTPDALDARYALDTTYLLEYDSVAGAQVVTRTPLASLNREVAIMTAYPITYVSLEVWPAAHQIDTLWNPSDVTDFDTVALSQSILQDTYNRYVVGADPSVYWTNRSVWRNNTMAENPPSVYTATFDALDENGVAYSNAPNAYGQADMLSSKAINLNVLNANSTYLSFFYQCIGFSGDIDLDEKDSLVLEFYAPDLDEWEVVWSQKFVDKADFELVMVPVNDPKYHKEGFKFRFYNFATLNGMQDQWHLDYVYLNNNRNQNDTVFDDLAMIYEAPSLLTDYRAMPWKHYVNSPAQYMIPSVDVPFRNNDDQGKILVDLQYRVTQPDVPTHIENIGGGVVGNIGANAIMTETYKIKEDFNYQFNTTIHPDSCPTFKVDFIVKTSTPNDTLLTNDTCSFYQHFKDYYAYDDGSAEGGYEVYTNLGLQEIAVEYQTPFADTLKAVDIYFAQTQSVVEAGVTFKLAIWSDITNPFNPDPTFKDEYDFPMYINQEDMPNYEVMYGGREDGFVRYYLPQHIEVSGTYYVGIINTTDGNKIPIGMDFSKDNSSKNFYRLNVFEQAFTPSTIQGSLMIRPVFKLAKDPIGISVKEEELPLVKIYPNPSTGKVYFETPNSPVLEITVADQQGKVVFNGPLMREMDFSTLNKGLYFVSLRDEQGNAQFSKLIIE